MFNIEYRFSKKVTTLFQFLLINLSYTFLIVQGNQCHVYRLSFSKRITVEDALEHAWIRVCIKTHVLID